MSIRTAKVPDHVDPMSIRAWSQKNGRYPAVIPYQWKEEFSALGINWAYALVWASVNTEHFRHPSWLYSTILPRPETGIFGDKGSRTQRAEIRHLAIAFAGLVRDGKPEFNRQEAEKEYEIMLSDVRGDSDNVRPPPPPSNPAPMPPLPKPPPPPQPPKPPQNGNQPPPNQGGSEPVPWKKILAIVVPLLSLAVWILPLPAWLKAIIKIILDSVGAG
jgi:hypothetical protein